jgi:hypothetical protein
VLEKQNKKKIAIYTCGLGFPKGNEQFKHSHQQAEQRRCLTNDTLKNDSSGDVIWV